MGALSFRKFYKKESLYFPRKKGGVGEIGWSCFKKGVPLIFLLTLSSIIFLRVFGICVFCLFTPISTSIIFVSHEELCQQHQINRHMTSTSNL